jgi:hypothetical protein
VLVVGRVIGRECLIVRIGINMIIQERLGVKVGLGIGRGQQRSRRYVRWREGWSDEGNKSYIVLGVSIVDSIYTFDGVVRGLVVPITIIIMRVRNQAIVRRTGHRCGGTEVKFMI